MCRWPAVNRYSNESPRVGPALLPDGSYACMLCAGGIFLRSPPCCLAYPPGVCKRKTQRGVKTFLHTMRLRICHIIRPHLRSHKATKWTTHARTAAAVPVLLATHPAASYSISR